jgi:hypothetical protein
MSAHLLPIIHVAFRQVRTTPPNRQLPVELRTKRCGTPSRLIHHGTTSTVIAHLCLTHQATKPTSRWHLARQPMHAVQHPRSLLSSSPTLQPAVVSQLTSKHSVTPQLHQALLHSTHQHNRKITSPIVRSSPSAQSHTRSQPGTRLVLHLQRQHLMCHEEMLEVQLVAIAGARAKTSISKLLSRQR